MPEQTSMMRLRRAAPCNRLSAERLVEKNLKRVHWAVQEYLRLGQNPDPHLYDEAVAEGNLILWRAARGFQGFRGNAFSTYATLALKRGLLRWREDRARRAGGLCKVPEDAARRPGVYPLTIDADGYGEPPDRERPPERECPDKALAAFEELLAAGELRAHELHVLRRRHLDGKLLWEVAAEMGCTRSNVQQIEARALGKLRAALAAAGEGG